jgi:four helix bundle protein
MPRRTINRLWMIMAPHKRFVAWQECHKLVLAVYRATESFPKHELYGLTSQLRRAAFSAAANLVEGAARKGRNEFRHFLDMSLGSLAEVEYGNEVALALNYLKAESYAVLESQQRKAQFLTWKLKTSMR